MKHKIILSFISCIVVLLASCQQQVLPTVYGTFDGNNKTMSVPATMIGAMPAIKNGLRAEGWDIRINNTTQHVTSNGTVSKNGPSKYTMLVTERTSQPLFSPPMMLLPPVSAAWIVSGCPSMSSKDEVSSLTVVDNSTGHEMFSCRRYLDVNVKGKDGKVRNIIVQTIKDNTKP